MLARLVGIFAAFFILIFSNSPIRAAGTHETPARVDANYPNSQPPYPDGAQAKGEQGIVLVDVRVRSSGRPEKANVKQSSGYADLDTAAVEGVMNWRFIPAMRDGDTVADWTTVKIVYQLPVPPPPPQTKQGP